MKRIVFGICGASGVSLAGEMLRLLASLPQIEIYLIISHAAELASAAENGPARAELEKFAHMTHGEQELDAGCASGSWQSAGMIVCPCSMSSLAAIATGCGTNLVHRAADVILKEKRPLVLVARETPLSLVHLRNMNLAAQAGATIMPFIPAFYSADNSLSGMIRQFTGRVLDQLGVENSFCRRWRQEPIFYH